MFGLFKKKQPGPFMEHPTGEFDSAIDAMEDAVSRLRALPKWEEWIAFCAQGRGDGPEEYAFAEVRLLRDMLDVGEKPLDIPQNRKFFLPLHSRRFASTRGSQLNRSG